MIEMKISEKMPIIFRQCSENTQIFYHYVNQQFSQGPAAGFNSEEKIHCAVFIS